MSKVGVGIKETLKGGRVMVNIGFIALGSSLRPEGRESESECESESRRREINSDFGTDVLHNDL